MCVGGAEDRATSLCGKENFKQPDLKQMCINLQTVRLRDCMHGSRIFFEGRGLGVSHGGPMQSRDKMPLYFKTITAVKLYISTLSDLLSK